MTITLNSFAFSITTTKWQIITKTLRNSKNPGGKEVMPEPPGVRIILLY